MLSVDDMIEQLAVADVSARFGLTKRAEGDQQAGPAVGGGGLADRLKPLLANKALMGGLLGAGVGSVGAGLASATSKDKDERKNYKRRALTGLMAGGALGAGVGGIAQMLGSAGKAAPGVTTGPSALDKVKELDKQNDSGSVARGLNRVVGGLGSAYQGAAGSGFTFLRDNPVSAAAGAAGAAGGVLGAGALIDAADRNARLNPDIVDVRAGLSESLAKLNAAKPSYGDAVAAAAKLQDKRDAISHLIDAGSQDEVLNAYRHAINPKANAPFTFNRPGLGPSPGQYSLDTKDIVDAMHKIRGPAGPRFNLPGLKRSIPIGKKWPLVAGGIAAGTLNYYLAQQALGRSQQQ